MENVLTWYNTEKGFQGSWFQEGPRAVEERTQKMVLTSHVTIKTENRGTSLYETVSATFPPKSHPSRK